MSSFTLCICSPRRFELAVKCLQHLLKCQLFNGIKVLHLFGDVANYTVSVHNFALSCFYLVCRLNAPVIVDCREDGAGPSVALVVGKQTSVQMVIIEASKITELNFIYRMIN